MRRMQMDNGFIAPLLLVHGKMQEVLFRGRIPRHVLTIPVELGEARGVEPAEVGAGRCQEPAVAAACTDVACRAVRQPTIEDRSTKLADSLPQLILLHSLTPTVPAPCKRSPGR